jgi:drug/metabolite transporter (DMT)-like permease
MRLAGRASSAPEDHAWPPRVNARQPAAQRGVRRRSVPLRIVGVLAAILGVGIVAFAVINHSDFNSVVAIASVNGGKLFLPLSQDDVLTRSRILFGVTSLCGLLTTVAGVGLFLGRRWGLYTAVIAALIPLIFPLVSRLLLEDRFHFQGPDILDAAIAALIGLVASLAFMFQSQNARAA